METSACVYIRAGQPVTRSLPTVFSWTGAKLSPTTHLHYSRVLLLQYTPPFNTTDPWGKRRGVQYAITCLNIHDLYSLHKKHPLTSQPCFFLIVSFLTGPPVEKGAVLTQKTEPGWTRRPSFFGSVIVVKLQKAVSVLNRPYAHSKMNTQSFN